jgi:hypothetical protein
MKCRSTISLPILDFHMLRETLQFVIDLNLSMMLFVTHAVAKSLEALCYKPKVSVFDSLSGGRIFQLF